MDLEVTRSNIHKEGLNQDLEIVCQKLATVEFWDILFSKKATLSSDYNHIHLYTNRSHNIPLHCQGNYTKVEKLQLNISKIDI